MSSFCSNEHIKECDSQVSQDLRTWLHQPGPSWLGNFVDEEIESVEATLETREYKGNQHKIQSFENNENFTKLAKYNGSNETHKICKDILLHLLKNIVEQLNSTHVCEVEVKQIHDIRETGSSKGIKRKLHTDENPDADMLNEPENDRANEIERHNFSEHGDEYNDGACSRDKNICSIEDEIEVLSSQEVSRLDAMSMIPNCYKRKKVTLTVPSLDLLPHRAWPKKKVYVIEILRSQLCKKNLSMLDPISDGCYQKSTSAITLVDDDIEILDVIPPQNSFYSVELKQYNQKHTDNDKVESSNRKSKHVQMKSSTEPSTLDTSKGEKRLRGFDSEFSNHMHNEATSLSAPNCDNGDVSDLRKMVYNKMIGKSRYLSRGFYNDEWSVFGQALQGAYPNTSISQNSANDKPIKCRTRSFNSSTVAIDLDFRAKKRFPIIRQDQCLPCDANLFCDIVKHSYSREDDSQKFMIKHSEGQNECYPQNYMKNAPLIQPNKNSKRSSNNAPSNRGQGQVEFKYYKKCVTSFKCSCSVRAVYFPPKSYFLVPH